MVATQSITIFIFVVEKKTYLISIYKNRNLKLFEQLNFDNKYKGTVKLHS